MIDRETQRGNRKRRQWGLHGHDRMGWKVNKMFRDIDGHYYYRDWHYFKNAQRKWNLLQRNQVST